VIRRSASPACALVGSRSRPSAASHRIGGVRRESGVE
jgi:hypothetical protein